MNYQPPLELVQFGLTDLEVHWGAPAREGGQYQKKLSIDYEVQVYLNDPSRYRIRLSIKDEVIEKSGSSQFSLSSTIIGLFQFMEEQEPNKRESLIRFLGISMLYSTLRGVLSTVAGVFPPDTRYVLPTVNMQEIIREKEAKQAIPPKKSKVKTPRTRPKEKK